MHIFHHISAGGAAIVVLTSNIVGFLLQAACLMLVPLQGAAVRLVCPLWTGHAGAGRCCLRVLLSEWRAHALTGMPVQGAVCCESGVCALLLEGAAVTVARALLEGCWCRCKVPLQGCCIWVHQHARSKAHAPLSHQYLQAAPGIAPCSSTLLGYQHTPL